MLDQNSLNTVRTSHFGEYFRRPCLDDYCFRNLPGTIERLLLGETRRRHLPSSAFEGLGSRYEKVVFILVDAFGFCFYEDFCDQIPLLKRIHNEGVVSCLTSMFPSTTAAHITTMHTGDPVERSGILEWYFFDPTIDRVISPLLFSFAGDHDSETLLSAGYSPSILLPETPTFHEDLASWSIPSWVFQPTKNAISSYSRRVMRGSTVVPYKNYTQGLTLLTETISRTPGPGYFFFYIDAVDSVGHLKGPTSKDFFSTAERVFKTIELETVRKLEGGSHSTLLLMSADHGQIPIDPRTVVYLNLVEPEINRWIRRSGTGLPIRFGGSCRDLILYIKEEYRLTAFHRLQELLAGKAEVHLSHNLISSGVFDGSLATTTFRERLGDIIILPFVGEQVYWFEPPHFRSHFKGHHGGMTSDEMEIPLMSLEL